MLYHKDVYLPPSIQAFLPKGVIQLVYTKHADLARISDEYGLVPKVTKIDCSQGSIFEVEIFGSRLVKFAIRLSFSGKRDITYVLVPDGLNYKVVTLWLNLKRDKHRTLNRQKYCPAPLTLQESAV